MDPSPKEGSFTCADESVHASPKCLKLPTFCIEPSIIMCIVTGLVVAIGSLVSGNVIGYVSPAIPNINSNPNQFHLTPDEHSWFVSSMYLAGIFGSLLSGLIMDRLGRKLGLMGCVLPLVIAWVLMASSINLPMFFCGRIILGVFKLPVVGMVIVYNAEISTANIRGALVSFHEIFYNIGICLCYIAGAFLSWKWLAITCAAIVTAWMCAMTAIPESPRWLLTKQKKEAEFSLAWLRGDKESVKKEMVEIQKGISEKVTIACWLDYVRQPLLKPLLISTSAFCFQELCGMNVVRLYTVTIFKTAGSEMDPYYQTIVVGLIMTAASCVCCAIVDCFERRTLLMTSGLMMGVSMTAFGVFFKLKEADAAFVSQYLYWLPIMALVIHTLGYSIGFGPVPYIIVGELFSTRARGRACSICLVVQCLCGFVSTKFFMDIKDVINVYGAFWIFAGICVLGVIVFYFTIPKTAGKALEQTQCEVEVQTQDTTSVQTKF